MKMTMAQLGRVARNLLKVIREKGLTSLDALDKVAEQPLDPAAGDDYQGEEVVTVHRRGAGKYSIDYFRRSGQTPIMFIVDPAYVKCILTADRALEGYAVFDDTEDGQMQDRRLGGSDFGLIVKEIESIIAVAAEAGKAEDPRAVEVDAALEKAHGSRVAADAVAILAPALGTARSMGDARRLASCLLLLGQAERHAGRPDDAAGHLEEALAACGKTGDLAGQDAALGNLLGIARDRKRYPEARAYGQRLLKLSHERGDLKGVGRTLYNLAYIFMLEGNTAEAETGFGHAIKILTEAHDVQGVEAAKASLASLKKPAAKESKKKDSKRKKK